MDTSVTNKFRPKQVPPFVLNYPRLSAQKANDKSEYLSNEFSIKNGWEPVYINHLGARMPYEELDYLVAKYWTQDNHPNVDRQGLIQQTTTTQTTTKWKRETTTALRLEGFPNGWDYPCRGLEKDTCVDTHLKYWTRGVSYAKTHPHVIRDTDPNKYVTFLRDCGGFNNIRQGFEFHVMVAWITNRTLVLPPDIDWYLIDRGPIKRGLPQSGAKRTSNFNNFFNIEDMSIEIPVITAKEFINKEIDRLNIPIEFCCGAVDDINKAKGFTNWLTTFANNNGLSLPWGQLANVLLWPDANTVDNPDTNDNKYYDEAFVDNRQKRQYTDYLKEQQLIHFPACKHGENPSSDGNYRYLGQIARSIAFADINLDRKYKQVLRDHVHLIDDVFMYAAMIVKEIGLWQYSSLHIRRNELQYKYVFCSSDETYRNVQPLLLSKEALYIATDEENEQFFNVFLNSGHTIYRWKDFFGEHAIFDSTKNVQVPSKLHGCVEMVVAACGRLFFGTKESTFSSYITRLRGYLNAPYPDTLYHHVQMTANDVKKSSEDSLAWKWAKRYRGQIYKIEFPDLWEDIKDFP